MNKLIYVKNKLKNGNHSLVICADCDTIISDRSGIMPLIDAAEIVKNASEIFAADKIVGKAAAMIYVSIGTNGVFAEVLSKPAKAVLERYGIDYQYEILTEQIINRHGDGLCPMEQAVKELNDPHSAKAAILQKIEELKNHPE